jgi:threonylcarbamoyladenosine tRNA methylthiotransferase MtaB
VHVFPFSRRPGTRAAELPDTPAAVKAARMEEMLRVGEALGQEYAPRWVGREVAVLFEERDRAGRLTGLTEHYVRLRYRGARELIGQIVTLVPQSVEGGELRA